MICVIDRKDTTIRYRAGCLYLRRKGLKLQTLPIRQLEQVVVYGNPLVETAVWRNLAAAGVPVIMLAARGRPQVAMLGSGLAVQLPLRRMQHRLADDPDGSLAMAKWFVERKIISYRLPLATLKDRYGLQPEDQAGFEHRLQIAREHLTGALSVGEIMGVEGGLGQAWFALVANLLPETYNFQGRNRRPPRDPVNSLLSLGYTLLLSEIRQVMISEGLDPSLGFLHQEAPGREALALDFQEIYRSGVDDFVLRWLADTPLDKTSFYYRKTEGCRLAKAVRPLFYQAWATRREEWPRFDGQGGPEQCAPIREQVAGQVAAARGVMKELLGTDALRDDS